MPKSPNLGWSCWFDLSAYVSTMLKRLYEWRVGCSPQQLLDFEAALTPACQDSISNTTLGKRYNGRYHCALLNQKTLLTALQINDTSAVFISLYRHGTIGEVFARKLAECNGSMPVKTLDAEHHKVFLTLKKRGIVFLHDEHVCMPAEFVLMLKNGACEHIAMQEKHTWNTPHCEIGVASPWIHEHDLWRIWLALHFMPLHRTGQGHFYKAEMKKLATILHLDQEFPLNKSISCLLTLNFLNEEDEGVLPASINWAIWSERQFNLTINWAKSDSERHMVATLLLELPVNQWLKLEHVTAWLNAKSKNNALLSCAPWHRLFTQFPDIALHHFDTTGQCIYLLPAFHAVLSGKIARSGQSPFPSPGWKGSEKSASESGVINAAGDIQLPPEFNHKKLNAFNTFCTLTKVEYQITLRINPEKISRVKCSKSEIKTMRALLESVQSPLPQALTYLFDKQMKLEPVAYIESTSLLIMLLHADDAKRIHALGFSVRQPFPDLPQVMLLEDGIYAHAFIAACQKTGILLETGTPPKSWIEGESCIFRWIHAHKWRAGDWLELCYWSHNGEMEQVTARLEPSYYIVKIRILETKNKRSVLQPYITSINSEDISRLRVLDGAEIKNQGLDKLS